jgi:SAM-dependent methyltransferase
MTVAEFHDPRLACLYDAVCASRADIDFYLALAGDAPLRVLDLCCGTGVLAADLAARGHTVTGVDAAAPMLAVARARPGGDRVTWVESDVRTVALSGHFDLIVLTGHAFQALLTDADVQAMLGVARAALAPGGRLAFETRNPLVRAWESWTEATSRRQVALADGTAVHVHSTVAGVEGDRVHSQMHYRFSPAGEELVSRQTLRFPTRARVERQLIAAGFTPSTWHGDWDASPCTDTSPEIIVVAR